jgi:hypothetical protein
MTTEDRKWTCIIDHEDDIDWDNIVANAQEDEKSGKLAFNSEDYATDEEAMQAMRAWLHEKFERGKRNAAAEHTLDASG